MERYAGWLRCPDCARDLNPVSETEVGCSSGHRFEQSRRGYIGLTPAGYRIRTAQPVGGETTPDQMTAAVAAMAGRGSRLLALGPAGGVDLLALRAALPGASMCALSAAPASLERIASTSDSAGVLADTARPWPIRDGAADVLVAIDALAYPLEFHRILARGGVLITAPRDGDLQATIDDLLPRFEHDQSRPLPGTGRTALRLRRRRRPLTW